MVRNSIVAGLASFALAGCGTLGFGQKDEPVVFAPIQTGTTTVDDIYAQFGQPHSVGKDRNGNGTVWRYYDLNTRVALLNLRAGKNRTFNRIAPTEIIDVTMTAYFFHADDTLWDVITQKAPNSRTMTEASLDHQGRVGEVQEIRTEMSRLAMPFDAEEADQLAWIEDVFTRRR